MATAIDRREMVEWAQPVAGLRLSLRGRRPIRRIQVYGQRCSGTHAIIRLIEANFGRDAFTEAFGFKHWFVPRQALFSDDTLVLTIARAPEEWLRSLHRQPWHTAPETRSLSFSAFIRHPWASYWDEECWGVDEDHPMRGTEMMQERCPDTGTRFANPIAKRTAKLRHWSSLSARAHNVCLLSYEALRDDPARVIGALGAATGLSHQPFVPLDTYKGHGVRPYAPTTYEPLTDDDRAHVAAWLDPEVEALFARG